MYLCKALYTDDNGEKFSLVITDNKSQENFDIDPVVVFEGAPIAGEIIKAIMKNKKDFSCNGYNYQLDEVIKNDYFNYLIKRRRHTNTSNRIVDFTNSNRIQRIQIYKSRYKCLKCLRLRADMNIESVTAKLYTITGRIVFIDLAYCKNCRQYFTDESTLSKFEKKHGILAIEKIEEYDRDIRYKKDSVLSRYGYKADGSMSETERRKCITFIIENGLGEKYEIIHHLNFLINDRGYRLPNAAERWESDLEFVHNYDLMKQKYVGNIFIIDNKPYLID